ncbi:MAG: hypothetical protein ACXWT1_04440 [Methylobacter sp.]
MKPNMRVLESITHHAPLGMRMWDIATIGDSILGLEIIVRSGERFSRTFTNRIGAYSALDVPGLKQFELNSDSEVDWNAQKRHCRIEVSDPEDRFLPFSFDVNLPIRGLYAWPTVQLSPPRTLGLPIELVSPLFQIAGHVPLFSSPTRSVPDTIAVVRTELRESVSGLPAAWCLLTVSVDSVIRGIGLSDKEGRVAILFPYPEPPKPRLTSSPPAAKNDFNWIIKLEAYYSKLNVNSSMPGIPDLGEVLDQFSSPRTLFYSSMSPPQKIPTLTLEYRVPLTVPSERTTAKESSFLFVDTA